MTLIPAALPTDLDAPLARLDPVAKLLAAAVPALVLLVSVDLLSAGIVVVATLAAVPAWGVPWRQLLRRLWPLWLGVTTIAAGTAVFTDRKAGFELIDVGPLLISTDSVLAGAAAGLRVAAIALPGVIAVMTIDPVDLADSLVAHLRVPARLAYGSLAALRLAPLMAAEWEVLGRARRARGLEAGRNPAAALTLFAGKVFALLVGAVRRGSHLAAAMDARGFDSSVRRTCARTPRLRRGDAWLVVAAMAVTSVAVGAAVVAGTWNPVLG